MRHYTIAAAAVAALWLTAAPAAHAQYLYGGGYGVGVPTFGSYNTTIGIGVPFGVRTYGVGVGYPYAGYAPGVVTYNSGYAGYVAPAAGFVTGGYSPWIAPGFNSYRYTPYAVTRYGVGGYGIGGYGYGRGMGYGSGMGFGRSYGGFRR